MPCADAMIKDVITATPDMTVGEAMALFEQHSIRAVPVVDGKGDLIGLFDLRLLLLRLLPLPVTDEDDFIGNTARTQFLKVPLDHLANASPWVARRLKDLMARKLGDVMETEPPSVEEDAPLREGIRLIALHGSPLPVVREGTSRLVGLISGQSIIHELLEIEKELKGGKPVNE